MFQDKALAILKSGRNVFLTGAAGSGKTYTLNAFIEYLRQLNIPVAVTASTGIAATHMKGTTVHSWTGIGIKDQMSHADLQSLRSKSYLRKPIENTHILIIDEISMLHRTQLDLINRVLRYLRNNPEPFGGMQVVFAGDFFQLPPVSKQEQANRDKFAFMSAAWLDAKPVICYLTEQHRQSNNTLNDILNELRSREISEYSVEALQECQHNNLEEFSLTRLYTHNADVDAINKRELEKLDSDSELFIGKKKGKPKVLESLMRSLIVQETLELKIGARVMFLKNDHDLEIMNGTMAEVIAFDPETDLPLVRLNDGREILAEHADWSIEDESGKTLASFTQIPLRLAWAITVHKSQGMTLEAAEVDLSKTFERGQGYVALSRLQDLSGLKLKGINRLALEVDQLASRADDRFKELSSEAEKLFSDDQLEHEAKERAEKLSAVAPKQSARKSDTYQETQNLLNEGKSLKEIMALRDLTEQTLIRHIAKLAKRDKKNLPQHLKPEKKIILKLEKLIRSAYEEEIEGAFTSSGDIKVSWVYNKLNGQYKFTELNLALVFVDLEDLEVKS